ncbi:MAG: bifunctional diaminohydroxyphosphoribosylaminopyrimidine deaminase/5-amino-6-(5-phosphoribosylamino)uracil reductase RibD [Limosilactobacillus sp.]|jgi:diaminohydroxyphosphoribosylaminopyrimidine deaminase/5-amino-6-(5-phosphoribosylamino)uracil reductase|nr:bifunctional diaminohydroxyphosphoribosylaminopyrimidine deaminase/5-amino-6-(5-phosphoribosylamino)uracil reductase RibD [Limosilactobacillus sp.]MCI1975240.1 bifunctional diaminohydroxyphosphoribosylaminopyrimidine deaminase/5-amino-6-(5-phosphoribosylamino)uracil reductase RibD [Limosilactobacillus sp.]MCI2030693.1 bifunctional diaminohydroxyphosphoribosylaminopyrimidine deaminase/5-amino-6-(5-phosphoribosylamino)uracil reductase RibD [Limosilactobacillus sp.]
MQNDEKWMQRAIKEAQKADYQTWQNPRVGAVVVKENHLLATGHTHQFGGFHAERDAISKLTSEQLLDSTLYVTLEPCNHYGKQPPCSLLITNSGIKRVVIAETDPHSLVTGKGIQMLKEHGIEVVTGILTQEAWNLNPHYNYFFEQGKPWVTLKQSISLDGKVAAAKGKRTRITNQQVYNYVHRERAWYQGIIVGSQTAIIDNPKLTVSVSTSFPPVRIVIDRRGRLSNYSQLKLLNDSEAKTWIFSSDPNLKDKLAKTKAEIIYLANCSIEAVVEECGHRGLQSLYVEGGPTLHQAFVNSGLVNEVITYLSPQFIGEQGVSGMQVPAEMKLSGTNIKGLGNNVRISGRVKKNV